MAYHMNPHQEEDLVHCNGIPTMETTMFASMKGKLDESQRPSQCVREGTNAVRGPGGCFVKMAGMPEDRKGKDGERPRWQRGGSRVLNRSKGGQAGGQRKPRVAGSEIISC